MIVTIEDLSESYTDWCICGEDGSALECGFVTYADAYNTAVLFGYTVVLKNTQQ